MVNAAVPQEPVDTDRLIQQLGPDPFVVSPHSLAHFVDRVPAAVIVEFVGPGELRFESVPTPTGSFTLGYATYRVAIRDVLFNRLETQAPPLVIGSELQLIQRIGREEATAFRAGQIPVRPGDECMLFLWHQRGWEILSWPAQFRRSSDAPGRGHGVAPIGDMNWVGPTVPASREEGTVYFDWESLVAEVRRMSRARSETASPHDPTHGGRLWLPPGIRFPPRRPQLEWRPATATPIGVLHSRVLRRI